MGVFEGEGGVGREEVREEEIQEEQGQLWVALDKGDGREDSVRIKDGFVVEDGEERGQEEGSKRQR